MALRILQRNEWEARLRGLGCSQLGHQPANDEILEMAEWWTTKNDKWFTVPCSRDGTLRIDDWQHVAIQVARLNPLDWDT